MKLSALAETLISVTAPRGWRGFLLKLVGLNVGVVAVFAVIEYVVHGHLDASLIHHFTAAFSLSVPLSAAGLAALGYLNKLRHDLAHLAATDLLTGLNNRRAFLEATEAAAARSAGVLMMLDLDHFKRINDTYGHLVGDECLRGVADVLRSQLRDDDIVGRIGGEEFAVFLINAPIESARSIGERLSQGASVSIADLEDRLPVTASVGAVRMKQHDDLKTVLWRADRAMYAAKDAGRARLVFWERRSSEVVLSEPV